MTNEPIEEGSEQRNSLSPSVQRNAVRERYATIAVEGVIGADGDESANRDSSNCGGSELESTSCCGKDGNESRARTLGYSPEVLERGIQEADLGLGCGNPNAIADLEPGYTVLDLGSGGGFDCFLAADEVESEGHVIGVDMTPEMVERARNYAERKEIENVEFRLGEIEALPVPDEYVDVVISNCVINLSPQKDRVFEEAYRVLEPDGRLSISDIAVTRHGRTALDRSDPRQIASCVAGAATIEELHELVEAAGFESVSVRETDRSQDVIQNMTEEPELRDSLLAVTIEGRKPKR